MPFCHDYAFAGGALRADYYRCLRCLLMLRFITYLR